MSTRAVIARKTNDGFKGRYHHWDGYPSGLGDTLFDIFNGHFKRDMRAMLKYLLDDHPAGWSTINGHDFALDPGFDSRGPNCYCHGSRSEKGNVLTHKNASGCGCEWAYVFDGDSTMEIYSSYCNGGRHDGAKMIGAFGCGDPDAKWVLCATVDLTAGKPDWEKCESPQSEAA